MNKLECIHADTCLPDYWGGHHLPHFSIPIYRGMKVSDLRRDLLSELSQGCIAGSQDWKVTESDIFHKRARAAIKRIKHVNGGNRLVFQDMDILEEDDIHDSIHAFFILKDNG